MCRLAAYIGPILQLEDLLLQPEHSLVKQSWAPREMMEARLNADGFGFGWFDTAGQPLRYRQTMPIWTDPNLHELGRGLNSETWVAVVRSATVNIPVNFANTMPYADEKYHFMHNGYIDQFSRTLRSCLRREFRPEFEDLIEGNTDSEHLFILFKQIMWESGKDDPATALVELVARLKSWLKNERGLLNIIVAEPGKIWALRCAINGECPTLYYSINSPSFPDGCLVASEPFSNEDCWIEVPAQSLMVFNGCNAPEQINL